MTLDLFRYQAQYNEVYAHFVRYLGIDPMQIQELEDIPFLPISLFKTQKILTKLPTAQNEMPIQQVFTSSGTTQSTVSQHFVVEEQLYLRSCMTAFEQFYGNIADYCVLALLPSYLERQGSSLVFMVNHWIERSEHKKRGFYLHNYAALAKTLTELEQKQQKTLLIGVSYALWDLAEQFPTPLKHTIVMETGGMKGKRKELLRTDLHQIFQDAFGVQNIHSEYGMTELLSQAYSKGQGIFRCPKWMKVMTRDLSDPLQSLPPQQTGAINIIDLANRHSCAFIATNDLGKTYADGSFEILGRMDYSDIRGCNLMVNY
ncbi:MAG: acyl transferase [Chitinophagales bacterium]